MNARLHLAVLAAALLAAGCAGPGTYPLGRATAGPNDPVLSLSVPPSQPG